MDQQLKQAKQNIRPYLRQITDQQLAVLTAMAQDGKVAFMNLCQCIRGIAGGCTVEGYRSSKANTIALAAERGVQEFGHIGDVKLAMDTHRNLRLFPMCKAEQKRREGIKFTPEVETFETITK